MIAHLDQLTFAPLPKPLSGSWQRPDLASLARHIMMVPVADTEILQLSHYLPLVIEDHPDGLKVLALLHGQFLARPVIGPSGQWLPAYAPIALRALPFRRRRGAKGQTISEVLRDPRIALNPEATSYTSTDGSPGSDVKALLRLAERLEAGSLRLAEAAGKLAAAGLLSEIHLPADTIPAGDCHAIFTIDAEALSGVEGLRLTALCEDALIGFELATAMDFSQRLLTPGLRRERRPRRAGAGARFEPETQPQGGFVALDVLLDGSELVRFADFETAHS